MRNIVKGLKAIGYRLAVANLNEEDKTVWNNMVASATSAQQSVNLLPEETAWWNKELGSESCAVCYLHGEQFCSSHN